MKFDSALNYYENMQAWMDYRYKHFAQGSAYQALSAEEQSGLLPVEGALAGKLGAV